MNYTSVIIYNELQEYYVHRIKSSLYTTTAINWPIKSSNRRSRGIAFVTDNLTYCLLLLLIFYSY